MNARTGDVVLFRYVFPQLTRPEEAVTEAAIVTCTHEDWSPGYHGSDGTWVPNTTIKQPDPGHVHLAVLQPTAEGSTAPVVTVSRDVPHQSLAKPGQSYWTERA